MKVLRNLLVAAVIGLVAACSPVDLTAPQRDCPTMGNGVGCEK